MLRQKKKFFTLSEQLIQALQDQRLKIVIDNAAHYVSQAVLDHALYDGIIIDCNYIVECQNALNNPNFYTDIMSVLRNGAAFT